MQLAFSVLYDSLASHYTTAQARDADLSKMCNFRNIKGGKKNAPFCYGNCVAGTFLRNGHILSLYDLSLALAKTKYFYVAGNFYVKALTLNSQQLV